MKVVFIKNNNFILYKLNKLEGYLFKPRNKILSNLNIIDKHFINYILKKKIEKKIKYIDRTIRLMLNSNVTEISDCVIMINEINRVIIKLNNNYRMYFDEFEYFKYVKKLYFLYMEILSKKKLIEDKL